MFKLVVALCCVAAARALIVCTPHMCDGVQQPALNCKGNTIKGGGFCGCTDVCAMVLGEACGYPGGVHIMGGAPPPQCDTGLVCLYSMSLLGSHGTCRIAH